MEVRPCDACCKAATKLDDLSTHVRDFLLMLVLPATTEEVLDIVAEARGLVVHASLVGIDNLGDI